MIVKTKNETEHKKTSWLWLQTNADERIGEANVWRIKDNWNPELKSINIQDRSIEPSLLHGSLRETFVALPV